METGLSQTDRASSKSATAIKWRGGLATRSCVHNEIGPRLRNTTRVSRCATSVARLAARAIEVRKAVVKRQSYNDLNSRSTCST